MSAAVARRLYDTICTRFPGFIGEQVNRLRHLPPISLAELIQDQHAIAGFRRGTFQPVRGGAPCAHLSAGIALAPHAARNA
jgi:hypothetical protein